MAGYSWRSSCFAAVAGSIGLFSQMGALAQDTDAQSPNGDAVQTDAQAAERALAEAEFQKRLSGATLVGFFTTDGAEDAALKPDRYRLAGVSKVRDDYWLFVYSHNDLPIPLTLKVLWAGKTPVLTLDEFTIAGMGTFSARVMFHGSRYAGTWQHGDKGGLMFGHIESRNSAPPNSGSPEGAANGKSDDADSGKVPAPKEQPRE